MKNFICLIFSAFAISACVNTSNSIKPLPKTEALDTFMEEWHDASAANDLDTYFKMMDKGNFHFLGTQADEDWDKESFKDFCEFHFNNGNGWDFTATSRHWYYSQDSSVAWFDEQLITPFEECRGTGVLEMINGKVKIAQYNLTVTIENDKMKEFIELRKK